MDRLTSVCPRSAGHTTRNSFVNTVVGLLNNRRFVALGVIFALVSGTLMMGPVSENSSFLPQGISPVAPVSANSTYYNFSGGNLNFAVTSSNTNQITTNDDWSAVNSIEGYEGRDITATTGVDPQTVLGTEFASNQLPNSPRQVNANKGNPSAYNAGGLTEFDQGPEYAIGFQGNVHANPYMVFYLNTTGYTNLWMSYILTDIDGGSNNSVSPVALQYRIGETGNFTNVPAGFVADVTDGPTISGRVSSRTLLLPPACANQAQLQIRLITTNTTGPDEWIGVNNVVISVLGPTAANASVGGRVVDASDNPIPRVNVSMTNMSGESVQAITNQFGYFEFQEVAVGEMYIIEVSSKRYTFAQPTQMVFVSESTKGYVFQAAPNFFEPPKTKSYYKRL